MNRLVPLAFAAACAVVPARAFAQSTTLPSVTSWGEASLNLVERTEYIAVSGAEVGKSDWARGAGLELRFMMPVGWGAYYRYVEAATAAVRPASEQFEWKHNEFAFGVSRRLLRLGRKDLWAPRVISTFDLGLGWAQLGTHQVCARSYAPFGTDCSTGGNRPRNVQGDALALEARVGAAVGYGPLTLGFDIGAAAYLTILAGGNSHAPPTTFYIPSGQLRLGLALPY